ncbi:MAG: transaldolase family protein [Coriobacteriales bacterium]|jgi:transaldolase|nr:transaldolase family protein [Coriobacteriales bacterium]
MQFFIDTADLQEIREAASWGVVAGVTTNPSLYAKIGGKLADFEDHIKRICETVDGPVSAEVTADDRAEMIAQGEHLAGLADNVAVKVPTTIEGLACCHALAEEGIAVNMTLCFTVPQAIMAARAGASFISPFIGRFDDIGEDGLAQLSEVVDAIANYWPNEDEEGPQIIAASVRSVNHVTQAALMGADIATVPFKVLQQCVKHPLTDQGLEKFKRDWATVR